MLDLGGMDRQINDGTFGWGYFEIRFRDIA